jgi:hypothetical protein
LESLYRALFCKRSGGLRCGAPLSVNRHGIAHAVHRLLVPADCLICRADTDGALLGGFCHSLRRRVEGRRPGDIRDDLNSKGRNLLHALRLRRVQFPIAFQAHAIKFKHGRGELSRADPLVRLIHSIGGFYVADADARKSFHARFLAAPDYEVKVEKVRKVTEKRGHLLQRRDFIAFRFLIKQELKVFTPLERPP